MAIGVSSWRENAGVGIIRRLNGYYTDSASASGETASMRSATLSCPSCHRLLRQPAGLGVGGNFVCPGCRSEVAVDSEPLELPDSADPPERRTDFAPYRPCSRCGQTLHPEWSFCDRCGTPCRADHRVRSATPRPTVWRPLDSGEVEVGTALGLTAAGLGVSAAFVFALGHLPAFGMCLLTVGVGMFLVALVFWK